MCAALGGRGEQARTTGALTVVYRKALLVFFLLLKLDYKSAYHYFSANSCHMNSHLRHGRTASSFFSFPST